MIRTNYCTRAVFCFFLFFVIGTNNAGLFAQTKKPAKRQSLAVLNITVNNMPDYFTRVVRSSVEVSLYSLNKFYLLERAEVDRVAGERHIVMKSGSASNTTNAVELGRTLAADFVIFGNVDKVDDYKLSLRVVSVNRNEIVVAYSQEFSSARELDTVISRMCTQIGRDIDVYVATGRVQAGEYDFHNLYAGVQYNLLYPVGSFGDLVNIGNGFLLNIGVDNLFYEHTMYTFSIGYYFFTGKENSEDSLTSVPVLISFQYRFFIDKRIYAAPRIGAGLHFIRLEHGSGDGFSLEDNTEMTGVDPAVELGCMFGFKPNDALEFHIGLHYSYIIEKTESLQFLNISAGCVYMF